MIRQVDMNEISDGKRYRSSDMVRMGTAGCKGCSRCCHGMGQSIRLDPMDTWRLQMGLQIPFEQLLGDKVELSVADGLITPNLIMGGAKEQCGFLDEKERCSVHAHRPGFCRLFPLGRLYEDGDFSYFLQIHECDRMQTKVRIRKWLELPDIAAYEAYIRTWHSFTLDAQRVLEGVRSDSLKTKICTMILQKMYIDPWEETEDFYKQFTERLHGLRRSLGLGTC